VVIAGANVADFKLLEATLEAIAWWSVPKPPRRLLNNCVWMRATTNSPLGK
jgi:hypothetical protein